MDTQEKNNNCSVVTGQKLKKKSLRQIKKEHIANTKMQNKTEKAETKLKAKVERKLLKDYSSVSSEDVSQSSDNLIKNTNDGVLISRKRKYTVTFKRKVLNFISYVMVGLIAVIFGYMSGNLYVANKQKVDFSVFSEESLMDDGEKVYNKIISSGVTPDKYTGSVVDLFVASEYKVNNLVSSFSSTVYGEIQPSIGSLQLITGYKNKNGNIYESEQISKGMLPVAEKYTYDIDADQALIYKATKVLSEKKATYAETPTWTMNYDEFRAEYGINPKSPLVPYIISSKTHKKGNDSVVKLSDGTYQISFSITTDSSVLNYVKQVKHMSGLKDYPNFKTIQVTAVIDKNFNFKKLRFDESYSVIYAGVLANCSGFVEVSINY